MTSLYKSDDLRFEISFNTIDQLRMKLSFYINNNIHKINIPSKRNIKNKFLLEAIRICKSEFPSVNLIPHFSIQHEFNQTKANTIKNFINFLRFSFRLKCDDVLLISGSLRKSTLDSVSLLNYLKDNTHIIEGLKPIGVAYNPYLPEVFSVDELIRLESKLCSGLVGSIWLQFGTDYTLLDKKVITLKTILNSYHKANPNTFKIKLYGSILIPTKLFNARFKFRPWKGVYCSDSFLNSLDYANEIIYKILTIYKLYGIRPVIETDTYSEKNLSSIKRFIDI